MEVLAMKHGKGANIILYRKDNKFYLETQSIFDTNAIPFTEEVSEKDAKVFFETMEQIQTFNIAFR